MCYKKLISYPLGVFLGNIPIWYMMVLDYRHNVLVKKYGIKKY